MANFGQKHFDYIPILFKSKKVKKLIEILFNKTPKTNIRMGKVDRVCKKTT